MSSTSDGSTAQGCGALIIGLLLLGLLGWLWQNFGDVAAAVVFFPLALGMWLLGWLSGGILDFSLNWGSYMEMAHHYFGVGFVVWLSFLLVTFWARFLVLFLPALLAWMTAIYLYAAQVWLIQFPQETSGWVAVVVWILWGAVGLLFLAAVLAVGFYGNWALTKAAKLTISFLDRSGYLALLVWPWWVVLLCFPWVLVYLEPLAVSYQSSWELWQERWTEISLWSWSLLGLLLVLSGITMAGINEEKLPHSRQCPRLQYSLFFSWLPLLRSTGPYRSRWAGHFFFLLFALVLAGLAPAAWEDAFHQIGKGQWDTMESSAWVGGGIFLLGTVASVLWARETLILCSSAVGVFLALVVLSVWIVLAGVARVLEPVPSFFVLVSATAVGFLLVREISFLTATASAFSQSCFAERGKKITLRFLAAGAFFVGVFVLLGSGEERIEGLHPVLAVVLALGFLLGAYLCLRPPRHGLRDCWEVLGTDYFARHGLHYLGLLWELTSRPWREARERAHQRKLEAEREKKRQEQARREAELRRQEEEKLQKYLQSGVVRESCQEPYLLTCKHCGSKSSDSAWAEEEGACPDCGEAAPASEGLCQTCQRSCTVNAGERRCHSLEIYKQERKLLSFQR